MSGQQIPPLSGIEASEASWMRVLVRLGPTHLLRRPQWSTEVTGIFPRTNDDPSVQLLQSLRIAIRGAQPSRFRVGSENASDSANPSRYRRFFPPGRWAPMVAETSPVECMRPMLPAWAALPTFQRGVALRRAAPNLGLIPALRGINLALCKSSRCSCCDLWLPIHRVDTEHSAPSPPYLS